VGVAVLDVAGPGDHIELQAPAGVEIRWLERGGEWTPENTTLAGGVADVVIPADAEVQVFVHGERESMKDLRRLLRDQRGLDRKQMSLSAYWAYGRAEDEFQAEKRTPIGKIFPEDA
jgi:NADPH-dependent ferric siderophore reductase